VYKGEKLVKKVQSNYFIKFKMVYLINLGFKFAMFFILWLLILNCHVHGDTISSRQEPLKIEVKNSDLIKPQDTTISSPTWPRTTSEPWGITEITTNAVPTVKRHPTVEPIIKVSGNVLIKKLFLFV